MESRAYNIQEVLDGDSMDAIEQAWVEADDLGKKRIVLQLLTDIVEAGVLPGFSGDDVREAIQSEVTREIDTWDTGLTINYAERRMEDINPT